MLQPDRTIALRRAALLAGVAFAAALAGGATAAPQTYVTPYLEADQVLTGDFNGGDVLTYSTIAAGVDAGIHTHRVEAQIGYRYEHRFGESGHLGDSDIHSGVARARVELVPNHVAIEGGALGSRENADFGRGISGLATQDDRNISKVYTAYVQPSVKDRIGAIDASASYRFAYVGVDDGGDRNFAGQNSYGHSTNQQAIASIGMDAGGPLPFGWNVTGLYDREDSGRLKQRFEQKNVIGEIIVPVSPSFALLGDIGYEKIENSQRQVLRDATGFPVINGNGHFVADPDGGRITLYDQDGLIYEGGFIWQPSQRTRLEARAGHRYGGTTVTASFDHKLSPRTAIHAEVYDGIDSFGRQLSGGLAALPTSFAGVANPLLVGGCVFGTDPGKGGCLDVNGLIGTANYRNRGVAAVLSGTRGRSDFGIGANYSHRRFLAGRDGTNPLFDDAVDQSYVLEAFLDRRLTERSQLRGDVFGGYFTSDTPGVSSLWSEGATLGYSRLLLPHLSGQATAGVFASDREHVDGDDDVIGSLLLGLRYTF